METKITSAQQIKDILEPIPADLFITDFLGEGGTGKSCAVGHINRHFNGGDYKIGNGYGVKDLTMKFFNEYYGKFYVHDIASVNNSNAVVVYNEKGIKDRVMHLINDMIKAGY